MDKVFIVFRKNNVFDPIILALVFFIIVLGLAGQPGRAGAAFQQGGDKSRPAAPSTSSSNPRASASVSPSPSPSPTTSTQPDGGDVNTGSDILTAKATGTSAYNGTPWIIGGGIVFVALLGGLLWLVRRNR